MGNVADGIRQIDVESGAPLSCSCYLIEDDKPALVETGPACQVPAVREGMGNRKLSYIIATHAHLDHAGGIGQFLLDSPETVVVAHEQAVRHLVDPGRVIDGIRKVFGDDFEQVYGNYLPVPIDRIMPVRDGAVISLGVRKLQILHTPGHVTHHISVLDSFTRSLFVGDALGGYLGDGFWPPVAPPGYDMELALQSTARLMALNPKRICLAHGGARNDPQELMAGVAETTRGCAGIILNAARAGESAAQIGQRIRDYLRIIELAWLSIDALLIPGFVHYFKRQGLL